MKRFITVLTASAFMALSATAADYTYKCKQRTDRSPVDAKVGKISVVVTHLKSIATGGTEYRGQYADSVDSVKVVVSATNAGKTTVVKTAVAIAVSEDVMFNIDNNGIKFHLYMDELEESGIELKLNGKKVDVSLNCDV
ncbi:MAG: hypothetical protein V4598_05390 [Bdellovibrionota bacterium]